MSTDDAGVPEVHVRFPVHCEYHGGNAELGPHGRHLWIEDGRIGHGELKMTHSIPLSDVVSVEVEPRPGGGVTSQVLMAYGVSAPGRIGHRTQVVTDVTVRTRDGQEAAWVVADRDVQWVRDRLAPALAEARVPFYGDLTPPRP